MNKESPSPQTAPTEPRLVTRVLSQIADENICPRSRLWFTGCECGWWVLWVVTTLIGAVAVGVAFFVVMHRQYAVFEATHDTFFGFMVEVLPYVWLWVFAVTAVLSYTHLRHTRRGYRYHFATLSGVSVLASVVGGLLLHSLGVSFMFDDILGKQFPSWYASQAMREKQFWQQPSEGRLLAVWKEEPAPGVVVVVEDVASTSWRLSVVELFPSDLEILRTQRLVRVLGRPLKGSADTTFHACGVFPWQYGEPHGVGRFKTDREEAIARLRDHRDWARAEARARFAAGTSTLTSPSSTTNLVRLCGEIAAVKRLR